jgi:hypothetical protein
MFEEVIYYARTIDHAASLEVAGSPESMFVREVTQRCPHHRCCDESRSRHIFYGDKSSKSDSDMPAKWDAPPRFSDSTAQQSLILRFELPFLGICA